MACVGANACRDFRGRDAAPTKAYAPRCHYPESVG